MAVSASLLHPRRRSSSSSSSQNMLHVVLFRKWGGIVVLFLVSVWWTGQLVLHTTLSDFHLNSIIQLLAQQHQRLTTTTTTAYSAASGGAASPVNVVDSSLSSVKRHQGRGDDASSFKRQQQQVRRIIRVEEKQQQQHSSSSDDDKSSSDDDGSSSSKEKMTTMREIFEETHNPNDWQRIRHVVDSLRVPMPSTPFLDVPYDIFNCPFDGPPLDYPYHWSLRKILTEWDPANVQMPVQIHQSLCVFDWDKDYDAIVKYREAEVPFIVENQPDLLKASERWMSGQIHLAQNNDAAASTTSDSGEKRKKKLSYLEQLIGKQKQPTEHSESNKFIYWKQTAQTRRDLTWKPPTEEMKLSYRDWYQRAMDLDQKTSSTATNSSSNSSTSSHASLDHWYFHVNAKKKENQFLYDELPIFKPDEQDENPKNSIIFMVEPEHAHGINCRFGMRGVLAAAHYDSQRNWVILMGGQRRYIISHPRECVNLHLYPQGHASGRHSSVDWTNVAHNETILQDAKGTEVVLQAAHALYLPSFWFHFIVSLNINYQCNARSGRSYMDSDHIADCGFKVPSYEEEL